MEDSIPEKKCILSYLSIGLTSVNFSTKKWPTPRKTSRFQNEVVHMTDSLHSHILTSERKLFGGVATIPSLAVEEDTPMTPEEAQTLTLEAVSTFFDSIDVHSLERVANRLLTMEGTLHISAVGPTAHIAKKASQTLASINVQSAFLHPIDALHGDVGNVKNGDVVLLLAFDDCEELVRLVPALRLKESFVIAVVSRQAVRIETMSDLVLSIDTDNTRSSHEAGVQFKNDYNQSFDMYTLILLDTLAVRLMHGMNLTKKQYAMNHPSGKIGKHLLLKVSDVLIPSQDVPVVHEKEVGIDILVKLASHSKGFGCILVVDNEMRLKGTLSDADFRRAMMSTGRKSMSMRTDELMNFNKAFPRTCEINDSAISALTMMNESPVVDYMPVLCGDGRVAGLITAKSLQDAGM